MADTPRPGGGNPLISTRLRQITNLASNPQRVLTSLHHHIDIDWLREAYRRTRKDGAAGIDGVTADEYEGNLDANLQSLLERFRSSRYKAPPVRRVHIPKADGGQRPLGIPTLEDKLLQRAVLMVLEPVFESVFHDCSHGFRKGRSPHTAVQAVWETTMAMAGGFVLELDIRNFFGTVVPARLREMLDQRLTDGVLRRTIDKWLAAGVLEDGQVYHPETGTPQGGVISPLLANIYLHHVLDHWFRQEMRPRLAGHAELIRYADDAVLVFDSEADARMVLAALPERFAAYGLDLHPEKTRLIDFRRPTKGKRDSTPRHFDFLGFRHYWSTSWKTGRPVVRRKTAPSRFARSVHKVWERLRRDLHASVEQIHEYLCAAVRGHCNYFGITGNADALVRFVRSVEESWHHWHNRRSDSGWWSWSRFKQLLERYPLPSARVVHSSVRR